MNIVVTACGARTLACRDGTRAVARDKKKALPGVHTSVNAARKSACATARHGQSHSTPQLPMSAFANLLQDPPPTHAFELSEEGLAFAPVSEPALAEFSHFEPGVLLVSPMHDNIQQPQVLLDHIQSLAPANGHRKRRAAVILPDYCARVAVLDFDTFPPDPEEQQALVRFRLKKSVPFEVDTAVVSYVEQPRIKSSGKVEILAAVMSSDIVVQYEAPFRAAGFLPGLVTTSSLAALNLLAPGRHQFAGEAERAGSFGAGAAGQRREPGALHRNGGRTGGRY